MYVQAACFVAPDVERPPPKTAEKVSDTNAMVPSFQIDELDDYKHDEVFYFFKSLYYIDFTFKAFLPTFFET